MAALNKIAPTSPSRQHPNETETSIANALYDLESNIADMKSALRPLQFVSAREVSWRNLDIYEEASSKLKVAIDMNAWSVLLLGPLIRYESELRLPRHPY